MCTLFFGNKNRREQTERFGWENDIMNLFVFVIFTLINGITTKLESIFASVNSIHFYCKIL